MTEHDDTAGERGWRIAQLRQIAEETRDLAHSVVVGLSAFDPEAIQPGERVSIGSAQLHEALVSAADTQEAAEMLGMLTANLTFADDPAIFPADALAAHSAEELRTGTGHTGTLLLCARLLSCSDGFSALAEVLASDPSLVSHWTGLSVRRLLGAFRDADGAVVERVCRVGAVHPDSPWADLDLDAVARIAGALRSASDA